MSKFYLIQRGSFKDLKRDYEDLIGDKGLIELDYMGSSEFEWGAIPRAYARIMNSREDYIFHYINDIKDYRGKIMVIFCKKEFAEDIEKEMRNYLNNRYRTKEFTTLHDQIKDKIDPNEKEFLSRRTFWWSIDDDETGDWMCWFGMNKLTPFKNMIDKDYNEWWLKLSEKEKQKKLQILF